MSSYARGEELAGLLRAAGLRVTLDPTAVTAPGVLLVPPARRYDIERVDGTPPSYTATWTLFVVAAADGRAWVNLDTQLDRVADVLTIATAELGTVTVGGQTYTCYTVTTDEETVP